LSPQAPRAILFDGFPLFDPRPVGVLAQELDPQNGSALTQAWRTRQFEYQWLRALGGRYVDFRQATEDSLVFAARQTGVSLTSEMRARLMNAYTNLKLWPDVQEVLPAIGRTGVTLGVLSNMTGSMLENGLAGGNVRSLFSHVLSTDRIRSYKPARPAYQMGIDALGVKRDQILFVAFAGWDVAGAAWFGYPTYWLNRLGSPPEELGAQPVGSGSDLKSLLQFLEPQLS
jgi:2-haloacid dehalogenase